MPLKLVPIKKPPYNTARAKQAARRQTVLKETVEKLTPVKERERIHAIAQKNHERWGNETAKKPTSEVHVLPGDWGDVTLERSVIRDRASETPDYATLIRATFLNLEPLDQGPTYIKTLHS